jgi:tRNA threonylcarbamoyladenosine biosynthesis protein TsaE
MTECVVDQRGLETLGRRLAAELPTHCVVWLTGPLGAGKTTLASAMVQARAGHGVATSPTYALVHEYPAPIEPIYHVDCYRLRHPDEACDLDWQTLVTGDMLLIEWPERAGVWAPSPTATVALAVLNDTERLVIRT